MRKNSFTKQISANNVVRWIELANQHSAVALNQATMFNGLMSIRRMIDGKPFIQSQRDTYSLVLVGRESMYCPTMGSEVIALSKW